MFSSLFLASLFLSSYCIFFLTLFTLSFSLSSLHSYCHLVFSVVSFHISCHHLYFSSRILSSVSLVSSLIFSPHLVSSCVSHPPIVVLSSHLLFSPLSFYHCITFPLICFSLVSTFFFISSSLFLVSSRLIFCCLHIFSSPLVSSSYFCVSRSQTYSTE